MKSTQNRTMATNRVTLSWFGANPAIVAANPALPPQIAVLRQTTDDTATAAATQEMHRVTGLDRSVVRADLRKTLREVHMQPIVNLARAIAPDLPALAADVRMPARKAPAERVLASASAMAAAVAPVETMFVANGLPVDFIDQLTAAATALRTNIDAGGASRVARAGATANIASSLARSRRAMNVIDTLLQRQLRGTPMLAEWESAKRITQPATSTSTSTPVTAPATAPVAAPVAAPVVKVVAASAGAPAVTPVAAVEATKVG